MKYIINNTEYDTETATLLCSWDEGGDLGVLFPGTAAKHSIYATPKKKLFHVTDRGSGSHAEILEAQAAQKLFDEHCEGIDNEAYKSVFEVKKG